MSKETLRRSEIAEALRRALDGQPAVLPAQFSNPKDWSHFSQVEKSAVLQIQNWRDDTALRLSFAPHEEYSRQRLSYLVDRLTG